MKENGNFRLSEKVVIGKIKHIQGQKQQRKKILRVHDMNQIQREDIIKMQISCPTIHLLACKKHNIIYKCCSPSGKIPRYIKSRFEFELYHALPHCKQNLPVIIFQFDCKTNKPHILHCNNTTKNVTFQTGEFNW